jgi:predicted ribosomally synthesized peptide with SipW-like signal peptide
MKRILFSSFIIVAVAGMVIGGTRAFFSDVETSTGNKFVAGSLDLTVDHTYAMYNDEECVSSCISDSENLIENGGFETPALSSGGYYTYSDDTETSWFVESGAGLEIQNNAAGAPHTGSQLAELASDSPSTISQTIETIPGDEYRLTFYYSPRPNVPAGDNKIAFQLAVIAPGSTIFTDTVMATSTGGSETAWEKYEYNFIAVDTTTNITFSAEGTNISYGGYLDDISITSLDCNYTSYAYGGTCVLWGERDLGAGDTFWSFDDVKPGDFGRNIISLHVFDNNAQGCAFVDYTDDENVLIDPEEEDGDITETIGELSGQISFFAWVDENKNNTWEDGETELFNGSLAQALNDNGSFSLGALNPENEELVGIQWCFGDMTFDSENNTITCDGSLVNNVSQTDILTADLAFYIEQERNNDTFDCADVVRDIN